MERFTDLQSSSTGAMLIFFGPSFSKCAACPAKAAPNFVFYIYCLHAITIHVFNKQPPCASLKKVSSRDGRCLKVPAALGED